MLALVFLIFAHALASQAAAPPDAAGTLPPAVRPAETATSPAAGGPEPLQAAAGLQTRVALAPYLDIVRTYREGDAAGAAETMRGWKEADVETAVRGLIFLFIGGQVGTEPVPLDPAVVGAAAMLHTDAALTAMASGMGVDERPTHELAAARRLLEALDEAAADKPTLVPRAGPNAPIGMPFGLQEWYLAVLRTLIGLERFDLAAELGEPALARFPDDAELWLTAGIVSEAHARAAQLQLETRPKPSPGSSMMPSYMRARVIIDSLRDKAESRYRRALSLDGRLLEAHARLGFLSLLRDRFDAADAECLAIPADVPDAYVRYLAQLCRGRIIEHRARLDQAADAYRAAAAILPDCQACRVALANVLDQLGDEDGARAALRPVLEAKAKKSDEQDGWWVYPWGHFALGTQGLEHMRRQVQVK